MNSALKLPYLIFFTAIISNTAFSKKRPEGIEKRDLKNIQIYAESLNLMVNHVVYTLPKPQPGFFESLKRLASSKSKKHEKYINLIMLKLYHNHLYYAHQSYEIRGNDFLQKDTAQNLILKEFCRFRNIETENNEFISSGEIANYLDKNKEPLKEYEALNKEYRAFDRYRKKLMKFYNDELSK